MKTLAIGTVIRTTVAFVDMPPAGPNDPNDSSVMRAGTIGTVIDAETIDGKLVYVIQVPVYDLVYARPHQIEAVDVLTANPTDEIRALAHGREEVAQDHRDEGDEDSDELAELMESDAEQFHALANALAAVFAMYEEMDTELRDTIAENAPNAWVLFEAMRVR